MSVLPEVVSKAWDLHDGPVVLTTVDAAGIPNAIYATCVRKYDEETIIVADNYFHKTRANIFNGGAGSLLFITKEGNAYQIKGRVEYHTAGVYFDHMKQWNPTKHPGHAAAVLRVERVFSGAEMLV